MDKETLKSLPLASMGAIGGVYKYYKPELAWAAIGSAVTVYDLTCPENQTLSETFRKQPLALQIGELALLSSHLLGILPDKVDPFTQALKRFKRACS